MKPMDVVARNCSLLLLVVIACGILGSGCFVIRGERRIKPDANGPVVKTVRRDSAGYTYCRVVDSPYFKMSVGVENGPARWELQFLFNILPIHVYRISETAWPLLAEVELEPKSPGITFDPRRSFFQGTNHLRLPPAEIWQDDGFLGTNAADVVVVTNCMKFRLLFNAQRQAYLDQDSPFQLSIEGIGICGQETLLPAIRFEPTTATRPGFRLPY